MDHLQMINIPVNDPNWGSFNVVVLDIDNPKWFGRYQTGKISIYQGELTEAVEDIPGYAIVYVLSEQDMPEINMVGYVIFKQETPFRSAIDMMYHSIDIRYTNKLIEVRSDNILTLH